MSTHVDRAKAALEVTLRAFQRKEVSASDTAVVLLGALVVQVAIVADELAGAPEPAEDHSLDDSALHKLWTRAVDQPGYVKEDWTALYNLLWKDCPCGHRRRKR